MGKLRSDSGVLEVIVHDPVILNTFINDLDDGKKRGCLLKYGDDDQTKWTCNCVRRQNKSGMIWMGARTGVIKFSRDKWKLHSQKSST